MSVVAITGDHPRHKFFVRSLHDAGLLSAWVKEVRESFVPENSQFLRNGNGSFTELHFKLRKEVELEFFGTQSLVSTKTLAVSASGLNDNKTVEFINRFRPKLILTYGCSKIQSNVLDRLPCLLWNCHGGLSPDYKGVMTHFWPSYMLEPQMTGMTLHQVTQKLDSGRVVHQRGASLCSGDGLHMLAARTTRDFFDEIIPLISSCIQKNLFPVGLEQKKSGKVWLRSNWRPEHLEVIYGMFNDRVVDAYLAGDLTNKEPVLISSFI